MRPKRALQERRKSGGFVRALQPANKFTGRANCIRGRQISPDVALFFGGGPFLGMRPKRALQERRKSGALSERYNCKPPQIVTRRPLDKATHSRWPSAGERGPRRCRENSFRQGQIRPVQSVPCTWSTARDAFLCPAWVLLSSPECRNAPRKRYQWFDLELDALALRFFWLS